MMNGEFVKELAERFRKPEVIGKHVVLPSGWTLADPDGVVAMRPVPEAMKVYTLSAVRDYVRANRDDLTRETLQVHVVSPQIVRVLSPLFTDSRQREIYVEATATNLTDGFLGKFMSIEEFVIGLQARFVETPERTTILRLFMNVKNEVVKTAGDDGMTQVVSAKAGVVLQTDAPVPNPVTLTPFRTFREVTQPQSSFVLRVKGGHPGGLPEVGLFEADGGAWRLTAVDRVRDWLAVELPEEIAVLA